MSRCRASRCWHSVALFAIMLPLTACQGDGTPADRARDSAESNADAGADIGADTGTDVSPDVAVDSDSSISDTEEPFDGSSIPTSCDAPDRQTMAMVNVLRFSREVEGGRVPGIDLDDRVSDNRDALGCFQADATAPDGTPGVDAAFSTLLPALEAVGGDAIEGLVQSAINMGELLLAMEVTGLDDPLNDDCVQVRISRGAGVPSLGTDGLLLAGQTYERDPEGPESLITGATIRNGVLEAGPFELALPLQVFDRFILFNVRQARLKVQVTQGGDWEGVMGGAVLISEIEQVAQDAGETVSAVLQTIVGQAADLLPNEAGVCQALSVALVFNARDGFFYDP
ncbi:MAG: hypothetical protein KGO50_06655 [Myxococcales bacterium]|nr:hypothetical protein [Myxococcales bacterium]